MGKLGGIPFLAAGIGCLVGGWFSSYLVRRSFSLGVARKLALGLSAAVMPTVFFIPHARISIVFVIFSLAYFGQQSWSTLGEPSRCLISGTGLTHLGSARNQQDMHMVKEEELPIV